MKNIRRKTSKESVDSYVFIFRKFKTPNQLGPTYSAKYTSEKNLVVTGNIIDLRNGTCEEFKGRKAWDLFYNCATFEEIFTPYLRPYFFAEDNIAALPKTPDLFALKTEAERQRANLEYEKQMLLAIRDNPSVLSCAGKSYNAATETLVRILNIARWSTNKKKATEAKNLLKDYLIPANPGGKRRLTKKALYLIMELTKLLALHLSEKCKKSIDYSLREYSNLDEDTYEDLLKKISDLRINTLLINDLSRLIFKPVTYAQDLVAARFDVSIKTIRRNI